MDAINEEKQFIDSNQLHRLYKLSHPELDATMQRLKQKLMEQFEAFRQRLVGSLNHINYFRYMRAFPNDDFKFIFRERVNVSKTQSRFQQKQQIMQRMNNFEVLKVDYSGVSDNCIYEIQQYLTEQHSVIDFKKVCPSGSTFININKDMIESILPYWDSSPEQMDLSILLKEAGHNFPKQQLKKLGSIFSQANQKVVSARLIFRASQHNFLSASFKDNCAGHAPTLMLAKSDKGYIFGGFTRCKWIKTKEKQYVSDPTVTSFLFSLTKNQIYKLKQNQKDYAISAYGGWGPIYGSPYGPDLSLSDKCHINDHSCSSLGSHYEIPASIKEYSNEAFSLLAGSKKFKVLEYEIYELLMDE